MRISTIFLGVRITARIAGLLSFLLTLFVGWYVVFANTSGHTGIDPYRHLLYPQLFALIVVISSLGIDQMINHRVSMMSVSAFVCTVFGVLFPVFLEETGSLREYNRWASSGLQSPPPLKSFYIAAYLLVLILSVAVVFLRSRRLA